jgi:FAD/FMN-containing dehydrogenase
VTGTASALTRFASIVGEEGVVTGADALSSYAEDITEAAPVAPSIAVKPRTAGEVKAVVEAAAAQGLAITPAVARMNVGGLTIPAEGGVVVDLSEMTQIVKLDREHMHAVIEPGVTFQQLTDVLAAEAPELTMSYPLAPPYVSVAANFLLDGLGSLSLPHGSMGEQIGGLEVVLPDGIVARTGACAASEVWFGRGPLPDLTGLFVNWQGASGIVTKIAVQLWPKPKHGQRYFVFCSELHRCFGLVRDLARAEVCHDVAAITWPTAKMLFGVDRPLHLAEGEPEAFVYFELGAGDNEGLAYKEKLTRRLIDEQADGGLGVLGVSTIHDLIAAAPPLGRFAEFPMTLDFMLDYPGGGLTWVGTYGPTSTWEEGATRCRDLMLERGFPPIIVTRPMKGGHYGVLRMITCFDKRDPDEVERVRALQRDLLEICVELGYIPYKAPDWAVRQIADRVDPGFRELFERVRGAIDPEGIMNPSRLPFST